MKNIYLLFAILSLALTGCETTNNANYTGEDAGYVVLGIGSTKPVKYTELFLKFREIGSDQTNSFQYFYKNMFYAREPDYTNENEEGIVLLKSLRPGKYEIYNYSLYEENGLSNNTHFLKEDISIPFTVSQGTITYLGNFQANKRTGKNFVGATVLSGAIFQIADRQEEEIRIAIKQDAGIDNDPIQNNLKQIDSISNSGFIYETK